MFTPLSFIAAAIIAILSALSYAELSSRFPESSGAALYVYKAFHSKILSKIVWWFMLIALWVSAWILAKWFSAYVQVLFDIPGRIPATLIVIAFGIIACIWISLSSSFVGTITIIQISWLLFMIWATWWVLSDLPSRIVEFIPSVDIASLSTITAGAFLAFYAFMWFEWLVNNVEEMKNPIKNLPRAIISMMIIVTTLYLLISLVAVLWLPIEQLQTSESPLAQLYQHVTGKSPIIISLIALLATMNGVLIQIITSSRLMYGMSKRWRLPHILSYVSPKTKTPVIATFINVSVILIATLTLPINTLAKVTSFLVLSILSLVSIGLVYIKITKPNLSDWKNFLQIPLRVPICAAIVNISILVYQIIVFVL